MSAAEDWAWKQTAKDGSYLAANLRLALLALARAADKSGFFVLRRKEIADLLQCSLDTVDRRIKKLEGEDLLHVERVPRKNGYGPSKYTLAVAATDRTVAATIEDAASRTNAAKGQRSVAARGNADLRLGETAKVAATDAASIRKPSTPVEEEPQSYPDKAEASGEGVCGARAIEMPIGGGDLNLDWVLRADERAFANERGYMNGSCDELFGQFLDNCATKGPRLSASWRSEWRKWVRNQVRFDTQRAQRAKPSEATHDASSASPAVPDVRRERVSPTTAARLRRRAERDAQRDAIDYGRVESERIS